MIVNIVGSSVHYAERYTEVTIELVEKSELLTRVKERLTLRLESAYEPDSVELRNKVIEVLLSEGFLITAL